MNERELSLLKAVGEAVKEHISAAQKRFDEQLASQAKEIESLTELVTELMDATPDANSIAATVLGKIEIPTPPELPDIGKMVSNAVAEIPAPELPDFAAMVKAAVAEIELPQPEPLPDIGKMVSDAVSEIPIPAAPELPDIPAMVYEALEAVELPQPEPLPDIGKMVSDAVAQIPVPEAPELPDFAGMVKSAVAEIELPQPEPLPDIEKMVADAVALIPRANDGEPGEDGRDALQLEILPHIDSEKSYPRGTYAIHNGGLWRSHQKTTCLNGWECLVDGLSAIEIEQEHERQFTITATKSSGEKVEKAFSVPVMIYRDIFKSGETYVPGDSVTWGGSVWLCNETTTDKPGEDGSKGWKLAVKRGRDLRGK